MLTLCFDCVRKWLLCNWACANDYDAVKLNPLIKRTQINHWNNRGESIPNTDWVSSLLTGS